MTIAVKHLAPRSRGKWPLLMCQPLALLWPAPCLATQQHGGTEGLFIHQLGHILFVLGMMSLLAGIHRRRLTGRGWRPFKTFIFLVIIWNALTFFGHWLQEYVTPQQYLLTNGRTSHFEISGPGDLLFYLSNLDNLVLVPAFFFLLLALRQWRAES